MKIIGFVCFCLLLVFCPVVWWGVHTINGFVIGCDGVGGYYSGRGFLLDVAALESDYADFGGTYQGTWFGKGFHPFLNSASGLCESVNGDGYHFDCDDFSFAVKCLGEMYGVGCREVFEYRFPNGLDRMWHFVVVCDGWRVFGMLRSDGVYYG